MKTFTKDFISQHTHIWKDLQILGKYAGRSDVSGLEIGSYEGQSACWIAENVTTGKNATLACVDPWWNESSAESMFDANTLGYRNRKKILKHKCSSRGYLTARIQDGLTECFDFVYIDGNHRAEHVLEDSVLAWPLLKRRGVLIWDDYGLEYQREHKLPREAITAFLSCRDDWCDLHDGYQKIVEKL